jgi:hypothetical protein
MCIKAKKNNTNAGDGFHGIILAKMDENSDLGFFSFFLGCWVPGCGAEGDKFWLRVSQKAKLQDG